MFRSGYYVSLGFSVYCLRVNVYGTTAKGYQHNYINEYIISSSLLLIIDSSSSVLSVCAFLVLITQSFTYHTLSEREQYHSYRSNQSGGICPEIAYNN